MEVISKIILGIFQGITELLPVSSSAHLIIMSKFLKIEMDLPFLTFLHFATGLAIFFGFFEEIKELLLSKERKKIFKIFLIAIIPAGITALLFHDYIAKIQEQNLLIVFNLIFIGILMIFAEKFFSKNTDIKKVQDVKTKEALFVGFSQIISLMPGISRSGITITSGMLSGISKKTAVTFSFLLGLPFLIFGFIFEISKDPTNLNTVFKQENLIGGLAAFIFGYFTLRVLKKVTHLKFLTFFGVYRILLGIILLLNYI